MTENRIRSWAGSGNGTQAGVRAGNHIFSPCRLMKKMQSLKCTAEKTSHEFRKHENESVDLKGTKGDKS